MGRAPRDGETRTVTVGVRVPRDRAKAVGGLLVQLRKRYGEGLEDALRRLLESPDLEASQPGARAVARRGTPGRAALVDPLLTVEVVERLRPTEGDGARDPEEHTFGSTPGDPDYREPQAVALVCGLHGPGGCGGTALACRTSQVPARVWARRHPGGAS